ncbi:hypothetical protein SteCoe_6587 [Stentor coeruleus]|uniref:Uncharacterized protein n=1 Tax=Stentor coeruleus TaxID=5963 RepID=A0A1R2CPK1_9CILI|nr:hypothetical protein SteCoe_6587 [Stentor coeruleus]
MQQHSRIDSESYFAFKGYLKTFVSVLKKAKSQQSLKNYQAQYRQALKSRAEKLQERECSKIHSTFNQSLSTIKFFNIFPLLFSYKDTNNSLRMPVTLYSDSTLKFLVKCDRGQKLITGESDYLIDEFIKSLPKEGEFPICIFKAFNKKIKVFTTFLKLNIFMRNNPKTPGYYQHFIPPCGKKAEILVTHARKDKILKCSILQNKNDVVDWKSVELVYKKLQMTLMKFIFQML